MRGRVTSTLVGVKNEVVNMNSSGLEIKVVIPARFGSSRLPGKPLIDLGGMPMVIRVATRVIHALPSVDLWIATDDHRIEEIVASHGYQVMMTNLEHKTGTDRIAELSAKLSWADDLIVINVQGDEPLVDIELLRKFSEFCVRNEMLDMASVMSPIASWEDINDPNVVKVTTNKSGEAITFSRSPLPYCRDIPLRQWPVNLYHRHVGIYAYKLKMLRELANTPECNLEKLEKLEQLRAIWLGYRISMLDWLEPLHAGVDSMADVERVVKILTKNE